MKIRLRSQRNVMLNEELTSVQPRFAFQAA